MHVGFEAAFQKLDAAQSDQSFLRAELDACVEAEQLGFDSVWVTEHHFSDYGLVPDPVQVLSYLAAATTRVQLGTAVVVAPWHDPVRLAEQVALLDQLSGGRAVIGLGRGLSEDEYDGLGVDISRSRELFTDHISRLTHILRSGVVAVSGDGGSRHELRPRLVNPLQGRLFSASVSPQTAALVAEAGLGQMFIIVKGAAAMAGDVQRFNQTWAASHEAGSEPPKPLLSAAVFVDVDPQRARTMARRYHRQSRRLAVRHYGMSRPTFASDADYKFYRIMRVDETDQPDEDDVNEPDPSTVVWGTPQQVLAQLADFKHHIDMQGVLLVFHGMPGQDGLDNMRCFAEHCLPELQCWPSSASF